LGIITERRLKPGLKRGHFSLIAPPFGKADDSVQAIYNIPKKTGAANFFMRGKNFGAQKFPAAAFFAKNRAVLRPEHQPAQNSKVCSIFIKYLV
jgi:hypothetical protein